MTSSQSQDRQLHGVGDAGFELDRLRRRRRSSRRTCGPSPRSTATSVGCAGSSDALGVSRSAATSVGVGSLSVEVGAVTCAARRPAAPSTRCAGRRRWRRTPSPARRSGRRRRRRVRARLRDQVGEIGTLAGAHPHRRRHRDRLGHRQRPAQVDRLLRCQRHRRRAPHPVGAVWRSRAGRAVRSPDPIARPANPAGGPGTATVWRRLTGWAKPDRVVLGDGEVGDAELHARRSVVGGRRR